jgi:hypothetical protein
MTRVGVVGAILMLAVVTSGPALGAQPKPLPLSARVIRQGDFAGVHPVAGSPIASFSNPQAWATWSPTFGYSSPTPAQLAQGVSALQGEGFVAAVSETLVSADGRGGYSFTVELGSPAGAQAEVARLVGAWNAANTPNPASRFSVAGIPAATGQRFGTSSNGSDHILFTDGKFAYHVGFHWGAGTKPARPALITAAQKLYKRVHGHPAA